ncbi:MAG TPA: hypothetical protein VGI13_07040 [Candidatus Acidoferrum sp.]|jgi:uncharacterized membrane protein YphA (DoxX/SURF4 family)
MAQGIICVPWHGPATIYVLTGGLLMVTGACILAGFLTPILGILAGIECLFVALLWVPIPGTDLLDSKLLVLQMIATGTALSLLGPGAYSLDARLFGWHEIVIPPPTHKSNE